MTKNNSTSRRSKGRSCSRGAEQPAANPCLAETGRKNLKSLQWTQLGSHMRCVLIQNIIFKTQAGVKSSRWRTDSEIVSAAVKGPLGSASVFLQKYKKGLLRETWSAYLGMQQESCELGWKLLDHLFPGSIPLYNDCFESPFTQNSFHFVRKQLGSCVFFCFVG